MLLALTMILSFLPSAAIADDEIVEEESEAAEVNPEYRKADYIGYVFPYRTTEGDQKQPFIDAAIDHINVDELMLNQYHSQVYGFDQQHESTLFSGEFLASCANSADLLDCRMFIRTDSCDEQLKFLRDVNGFPCYEAGDCVQFGGTEYTVTDGDIIFWLDEKQDNKALNVGIVSSVEGESVHAIVCNIQVGYGEMVLNSESLKEAKLENAVVVNPEYPCYEHLVFFYCINELGMTIPAACGLMCNIYHESAFNPTREEELNSLGYGLCQWSRTRRQMLTDYCAANNKDYTKLYSQLDFLIYELKIHEPELLEYLQNPFSDAYQAGYKICAEYECPDGGEEEAQRRGNETLQRFYNAYGGHPYIA
jgi:hypothetical protein